MYPWPLTFDLGPLYGYAILLWGLPECILSRCFGPLYGCAVLLWGLPVCILSRCLWVIGVDLCMGAQSFCGDCLYASCPFVCGSFVYSSFVGIACWYPVPLWTLYVGMLDLCGYVVLLWELHGSILVPCEPYFGYLSSCVNHSFGYRRSFVDSTWRYLVPFGTYIFGYHTSLWEVHVGYPSFLCAKGLLCYWHFKDIHVLRVRFFIPCSVPHICGPLY